METEVIKTKSMVVLHSGRVVDGGLYDTILQLAKDCIGYLQARDLLNGSEEFTSEMFCGDEQWSIWTNEEKRTAGRCLVSMAMTNTLPLETVECVGRKHATPTKFLVIK